MNNNEKKKFVALKKKRTTFFVVEKDCDRHHSIAINILSFEFWLPGCLGCLVDINPLVPVLPSPFEVALIFSCLLAGIREFSQTTRKNVVANQASPSVRSTYVRLIPFAGLSYKFALLTPVAVLWRNKIKTLLPLHRWSIFEGNNDNS